MFRKIEKYLVVLLGLATIWVMAAPAANAQSRVLDKKTTITVNQPFELPGNKVLPAGTYVMRLVDVAGVRNIVRFYSADEKEAYVTVMGIPDFKLSAPNKTDITFYESTAGTPRPLHAWFYPGSQFGIEFAYPKERAVEIAKSSAEHVIALNPPATAPEPIPAPTERELREEPLTAIEPGGEEVQLAEVHPEAPPVQQAEVTPPTLPTTATPFALIGLIGLLAAGAATGLRFVRK